MRCRRRWKDQAFESRIRRQLIAEVIMRRLTSHDAMPHIDAQTDDHTMHMYHAARTHAACQNRVGGAHATNGRRLWVALERCTLRCAWYVALQ